MCDVGRKVNLVQPLCRKILLQEIKIELPYGAAITLLGIYPRKTIYQKYIHNAMFIALFTLDNKQKQLTVNR